MLLLLLLLSSCLWAPPDTGEVEECEWEVLSVRPGPGEDLYYRDSVEVDFRIGVHTTPVLSLRGPDGVEVEAEARWRDTTRVLTPVQPLEPQTTYDLVIDRECLHEEHRVTTSEAGLPVDSQAWEGVWVVDLAEGEEGSLSTGTALGFAEDERLLLDLAQVGEGWALRTQPVALSGWPPTCTAYQSTLEVTGTEGPWFETGSGALELPTPEGRLLLVLDRLEATIRPDGPLEGLTLEGELDTRYAAQGAPGALCESLADSWLSDVDCGPCQDLEPWCLPLRHESVRAEVVGGLERLDQRRGERCNGVDDDCDGLVDEGLLGEGAGCPAATCKTALEARPWLQDGTYFLDAGTGASFEAWCDMTTEGGGWTRVAYAEDLGLGQHHSDGDGWEWLDSDLALSWEPDRVAALAALSTEGRQTWQASCQDIVHYFDVQSSTFEAAAGFRFLDGTETTHGSPVWTPHEITVTLDECASGGSGHTVFSVDSPLVPIVNIELFDGGDPGERFGADLLEHPAWLR